jgi:hypothetical protein
MSTLANNEEGLCFKADILQCGASTKQPCSSVTQDLENVQEFVQMSSCASGTTCCLPGYYGASSASCTACLLDKPSSPFSAPNSNCECPNSGSNKCFACNNKEQLLASRQCELVDSSHFLARSNKRFASLSKVLYHECLLFIL